MLIMVIYEEYFQWPRSAVRRDPPEYIGNLIGRMRTRLEARVVRCGVIDNEVGTRSAWIDIATLRFLTW